ncbi:hypothetical protein V2J09_014497 [Rumex salicifolius]
MAGYRRYELVEQTSSPFYIKQTSIFAPKASPFPFPSFMDEEELSFALDVLSPSPLFPSFPKVKVLDFPEKSSPFDSICEDLVQIETTPFQTTYKRVVQRRPPAPKELYLQKIADRVSALESKFDRMLKVRERELVDRKYTWTAEIGGPVERKYKVTAEIKGSVEEEKAKEKKNNKKVGERSYKWMTEIKGKDDEKRTYTWKATIGGDKGEKCEAGEGKKKGEKKKKEKKEKRTCEARIVEIEDPSDHRTVILRQAFARRVGGASKKGKTKELSPQDAAMMIQFTFREYLIRRSRALRALRELAVAKTKLKELRTLFHNFSYRNRVARDAEERQKFSERIIVLLLTVDAIEGVDIMVRAAKRSMVDELEAMLDVVDPQPGGKSFLMTRRTFDMPSGDIQKEIEEGVAQVVQMIEEENASD